jgi:hypothetical protein
MMPVFQLGQETRIALLSDGTEISIDADSVLTKLQLIVGRGALGYTRQLQVFSREIVGVRLHLRHPHGPAGISAPSSHGSSAEFHVPEGSIVSRLGFGNEAALKGTSNNSGSTRYGVLAGTRSDRRCLIERSGFGVRCR